METKQSRNIVFVYVKLPVAINAREALNHPTVSAALAEVDIISRDLEQMFFQDKAQGHFVKIGEGAFLADEDAWYPQILSMMKWCDERKFSYAILPIGDSASTFTGEKQEIGR